jgi:hypothetical protein
MASRISAYIHCEWAFACPKEWESLSRTEVSNVRYCDSCKKEATLALGPAHLDALTEAGSCVAVIWGRRVENVKRSFTRLGLRMPKGGDGTRPFTDNI